MEKILQKFVNKDNFMTLKTKETTQFVYQSGHSHCFYCNKIDQVYLERPSSKIRGSLSVMCVDFSAFLIFISLIL